MSLRSAAAVCLLTRSPSEKIRRLETLSRDWYSGRLAVGESDKIFAPQTPGRPDQPKLVHPARVPKRRLGSEQGRMALIHAVAHIEFNAINLALDAVSRFPDLPTPYYADWISVAVEEAEHFQMLSERLSDYGCQYGELDAHDGLWEMAVKTADDPLKRMALGPRLLEARGLDVTPGMITRLEAVGDTTSVRILKKILCDEVGHVEKGSRWFRWLCEQRGLDSDAQFIALLRKHVNGPLRGPFNLAARRKAGFTELELAEIEA